MHLQWKIQNCLKTATNSRRINKWPNVNSYHCHFSTSGCFVSLIHWPWPLPQITFSAFRALPQIKGLDLITAISCSAWSRATDSSTLELELQLHPKFSAWHFQFCVKNFHGRLFSYSCSPNSLPVVTIFIAHLGTPVSETDARGTQMLAPRCSWLEPLLSQEPPKQSTIHLHSILVVSCHVATICGTWCIS